MSTDKIARSAPSSTPSLAGDGVLLPLAGGTSLELRFSSRNLLRVENTFEMHRQFLVDLQLLPINTLAWVLINCCGAQDDDQALALLDGCPWWELSDLVVLAWNRAHPPYIEPVSEGQPDPTPGSKRPKKSSSSA